MFEPGRGIDVRPHPHIGLATVTFLWSGTITHRDTLGSVQDIDPGDVNWMTAGRGIAHSERTPLGAARARASAARHADLGGAAEVAGRSRAGILPPPRLDAAAAGRDGAWLRVIAGRDTARNRRCRCSPTRSMSRSTWTPTRKSPSTTATPTRAVPARWRGATRRRGPAGAAPGRARPGARHALAREDPLKAMLLGGEPLDGRATCGGTSCRRRRSGSSRPSWTGWPAVREDRGRDRVHPLARTLIVAGYAEPFVVVCSCAATSEGRIGRPRIQGHIATQELTLRNVTFNATTAAHQGWWMRDSPW